MGWGDGEATDQDPAQQDEAPESGDESEQAPLGVAKPNPTQRVVSARNQPNAAGQARMPRINPRDLMPADLIVGGGASQPRPSGVRVKPATTPSAGGSRMPATGSPAVAEGSAQARLYREMQQQAPAIPVGPQAVVEDAPNVAGAPGKDDTASLRRRPQPRAGSVLSSDSDWLTTPPQANRPQPIDPQAMRRALVDNAPLPSANTDASRSALARSIAAEVAQQMNASPAPTTSQEPASTSTKTTSPVPKVESRPTEAAPSQAPTTPTNPEAASGWIATDTGLSAPSQGSNTIKPIPTTAAPSISSTMARDVLMSQHLPAIASNVSGPDRIVVGREARYRVVMRNQGDVAAERLTATVTAPEWAEVRSAVPSIGVVPGQSSPITWSMDRLEGGAEATLELVLVARTGRPIELAVSWSQAPIATAATVQVEEPKLTMAVAGPDEVQFGRPQRYRLTLTNPGTGVSEGVQVHLLPPGSGQGAPSTHTLGDLPAGMSRSVEVELTPREAGQLVVKARATAVGGLTAECSKPIRCLKPELRVDWRCPQQAYAGAVSAYDFRVHNAGTSPAEGAQFAIKLPTGFEPVEATDGRTYNSAERTLTWNIGTLAAGDSFYLRLNGAATQPGECALEIGARSADNLTADANVAKMTIVALADLKLEIQDPKGPLPLEKEVTYQIRVKNRGQVGAEAVRVVALFSQGIEPLSASGAPCKIADGRVAFETTPNLAAGQELVLSVRAKAQVAGTHIFRAEAQCRDQGNKLSAEETTQFYQNDATASSAIDRFSQPR